MLHPARPDQHEGIQCAHDRAVGTVSVAASTRSVTGEITAARMTSHYRPRDSFEPHEALTRGCGLHAVEAREGQCWAASAGALRAGPATA